MATIRIDLPESVLLGSGQSQEEFVSEAKFLLAVKLFELRRLSSSRAAAVCSMNRVDFLLRAGRSGVPVADIDESDSPWIEQARSYENGGLICPRCCPRFTGKDHRLRREADSPRLAQRRWYFSVVDIIAALTDSEAPGKYWSALKRREAETSGFQLSTICRQLKLTASDGKNLSYRLRQHAGSIPDYPVGSKSQGRAFQAVARSGGLRACPGD